MNLITLIEQVFKHRKRPTKLAELNRLSDDERREIEHFESLTDSNLTLLDLEECFDIMYWFTPETYCYFLPAICIVGLKAQRNDLLIYDAIIGPLDRSPEPLYWDDFFTERWQLLTCDECNAMQQWLLWLAEEDSPYDEITLNRSFDTLALLVDLK